MPAACRGAGWKSWETRAKASGGAGTTTSVRPSSAGVPGGTQDGAGPAGLERLAVLRVAEERHLIGAGLLEGAHTGQGHCSVAEHLAAHVGRELRHGMHCYLPSWAVDFLAGLPL